MPRLALLAGQTPLSMQSTLTGRRSENGWHAIRGSGRKYFMEITG
jgi:hypothetical protein